MAQTQHLVIVRRNNFATFALLAQAFADEPHVRLVWDRRVHERRRTGPSDPADRRRRDRRGDPSITWGGRDYLLLNIANDVESGRVETEMAGGDAHAGVQVHFSEDIGCDIEAAIASDLAVLISGGDLFSRKSLAQRIHRHSDRGAHPLIILDRDAFLEVMVSGTLSRGASPGDVIERGTLLIEEVSDLTWKQQSELVRFLERRAAPENDLRDHALRDARIISGTGRPLLDRVASRQFRADLFYRLNAIHLVLPSGAVGNVRVTRPGTSKEPSSRAAE